MTGREQLLIRLYIVLGFVLLIAGAIVINTLKIGFVEKGELMEKMNQLHKIAEREVKVVRGSIYAADGNLLVTSIPFFDIYADFHVSEEIKKKFKKEVDSLAYYIARDLDPSMSKAEHKKRLVDAFNKKNRYIPIKSKVDYLQLAKIKEFPIFRDRSYSGLIVKMKETRYTPFKNLGYRTIGLKRDNAASVGLEAAYDKELSGESVKFLSRTQNKGSFLIPVDDLTAIEPKTGMDLITTLDVNIMDITHNALLKTLEHHQADYGSAIVMEVGTGAIKAISNLGQTANGGYGEVLNYAVMDASEPGSTFKLASYMALFEDGYLSLNDTVDLNKGVRDFSGQKMYDSEHHNITLTSAKHAFEISSNVGIAKMVNEAYGSKPDAKKLINRFEQFGLRSMAGINIEGEAAPYIKDAYDESNGWSKLSLPWMAHGYELQITPLQMLTFYNSVANDGKRMKPYLVSRIESQGEIVKEFEPEVLDNSIAKSKTIKMAKEMLEGVMTNGTGKNIIVKGMSLAGKTGTSRIEYGKGGDQPKKYQASFVGYFPAENPQYSVIVVVKNPKVNGYYGGTVAGKVFKEIAENILFTHKELQPIVNAEPKEELEPSQLPINQAGLIKDFEKISKKLDLKIENNADGSNWGVVMIDSIDGLALKTRTVEDELIPSVVGMGLRDALFLLENKGLKVAHKGIGKVSKQSIRPGTRAVGQQIEIVLK